MSLACLQIVSVFSHEWTVIWNISICNAAWDQAQLWGTRQKTLARDWVKKIRDQRELSDSLGRRKGWRPIPLPSPPLGQLCSPIPMSCQQWMLMLDDDKQWNVGLIITCGVSIMRKTVNNGNIWIGSKTLHLNSQHWY